MSSLAVEPFDERDSDIPAGLDIRLETSTEAIANGRTVGNKLKHRSLSQFHVMFRIRSL